MAAGTARSSSTFFYLCLLAMVALASTIASAQLSTNFYDKVCPKALPTIKSVVADAVRRETRMGASLLRLHFHDCFVNGCDGSLLLDGASGEKFARPNRNSLRGFDVVDRIKSAVDKACGGPVVSCADILAVAARDSVVALGGPTWNVPLGRRDSTTSSQSKANSDIPSPFLGLQGLKDSFKNQGLDETDLVALSGGHTIGFSQCRNFRTRIYNTTANIFPGFARNRQKTCPRTSGNGDFNLAPLDHTAQAFDTQYFDNLVKRRGLLTSDQALFEGGSTDALVKKYSTNFGAFSADFAKSMIKMGNIKPLTGTQGQIRKDCKKVN